MEGSAALRTEAGVRPEPTPQRSGPRPEDIGFGRRFLAATSFGSVLTFLVNVPLAVVGIAAILAWLPADDQRVRVARAWHELDPPGLVLFAAALTAHELRARTPFLDVRMLARNRALTTTYVRFCITMLITYGFIYGWTPWLEQSAGLSAADAGLLLVPSFAVAVVVSALAAWHRRIWPLLVAGATALAAGSAGLLLLTGRSPLWLLLAVSVVFGAQNGLNVVTNQAAMYGQAPRTRPARRPGCSAPSCTWARSPLPA